MLIKRRRFRQTESLNERLVTFAKEASEKAMLLSGHERYALLQTARQADTAAHIHEWVNSPGLQPPK